MSGISEKLDALIHSVDKLHLKIDTFVGAGKVSPIDLPIIKSSGKGITLTELARRSDLENGQQRVAVIVGYFEKIQAQNEILTSDIQRGWKDGKFSGKYAGVFLHRALKEGLVREKSKGAYDLTQTGEDFFSKLFATVAK
jgi:hypothetical protein